MHARPSMMPPFLRVIASPVGRLTLAAADGRLVAVLWEDDDPRRVPLAPGIPDTDDPVLTAAERQLGEYFAGARRSFDLPLGFVGTPFQRDVWRALLTIPFGETRSYGQIAHRIGRPTAARAVGAANGRNPLSIVAPCHRVIGSAGALTGFAGGLAAKRHLLALERPSGGGGRFPIERRPHHQRIEIDQHMQHHHQP